MLGQERADFFDCFADAAAADPEQFGEGFLDGDPSLVKDGDQDRSMLVIF